MHKVFLFGSMSIGGIPTDVRNQLEGILKQTNGDVEFIVGDAPGVDSAFHKILACIGASDKSTIYCMDSARNNKFGLREKVFNTEYNAELGYIDIKHNGQAVERIEGIKKIEDIKFNRNYYEFKDKQMRNDCTFAICIWDRKSKGTSTNINMLKARGKYVYIYTV